MCQKRTLTAAVRSPLGRACIYDCTVPNSPYLNVILGPSIQSIHHQAVMSLSSDSLPLCCKRTATKRALNNGDHLIVKKRAREATAIGKTATPTSNTPKVSLFFFRPQMILNRDLDQCTSIDMECDDDFQFKIPPTKMAQKPTPTVS